MPVTNKTYVIRTVEDMIQLEPDQLDRCLADLKTWVLFRKDLDVKLEGMKEMAKSFGLNEDDVRAEVQDHMAWEDDGVEGGEVRLTISDDKGNLFHEEMLDLNDDGTMKQKP